MMPASIITADGEWIGKSWVRIARGQAEHDSMLAREKMITALQKGRQKVVRRGGRPDGRDHRNPGSSG